jgi:hypothetical protein
MDLRTEVQLRQNLRGELCAGQPRHTQRRANGKVAFSGWSGACNNSTGDCTVIMDGNTSVTATFGRR